MLMGDVMGGGSSRNPVGSSGGGPGSGAGGAAGLDPESEISRNRDFYRSQDVRPPFTYAALIRQVSEREKKK